MEEGCQVFIQEEADEHEDAKEGNPASSAGSADTDKQVFIKEEADEHEDAKEGNPAYSSGSADTDKQVNSDFYIFLFKQSCLKN